MTIIRWNLPSLEMYAKDTEQGKVDKITRTLFQYPFHFKNEYLAVF